MVTSSTTIMPKTTKSRNLMASTAIVQLGEVVNVAAVVHRSPFRYPGGKTWLVPRVRQWLKSLKPAPRELAEPFAGGAIVSLSALLEEIVQQITMVEKDEDVAAVWDVIIYGEGSRLANDIVAFNPTDENIKNQLKLPIADRYQRAFTTIVRNRVQRGGIIAAGASLLNKGENKKGMRSRWYPETLKKRINAIIEKRRQIAFIQGDGIDFIRYNAHRADTAFFIDPPYTQAARRLYTFGEIDHRKLFKAAMKIKGDFLMTYDATEEIQKLAKEFGFQSEPVAMKNTHHEIMNDLVVGKNLAWLKSATEEPQSERAAQPDSPAVTSP
ncbi:MAG: class adenine-specific methyltransferase [Candidatus Sulfotelmatobacter sp.]|nr:class adenine-specific methyltransferase [Candidatus Sulfotelmatobacter sp.]